MTGLAKPRILVADDDPIALQFFQSALHELRCEAIAVTDGNAALAACAAHTFDLLILDRRMPGLGGAELLRALRARGLATPAIATSAELDRRLREELASAGYADALTKPIGIEPLRQALLQQLGAWPECSAPRPAPHPTDAAHATSWLDDASALTRVGGDAATLLALRTLFAQELDSTMTRWAATASPPRELGEYLHRLRASCRYCGANRLGATAERLETRLRESGANAQAEMGDFIDACRQTLAALRELR
jgi:CheY-like chemotaxis protein/HPt (histidine-containing phosphotransfer) domain-containing protein